MTYASRCTPHDIIGRAMSVALVFFPTWVGYIAHAVIDDHRQVWRSPDCWLIWRWPSRRRRINLWRMFEGADRPVAP